MFFNCVVTLFLIHILNPANVLSYEKCNEFTITFDEIANDDKISTFERGSFGILNNLTKQCRNLNIAIEMDLHRDEDKSKLYKDLYGDDLHKINVTYPLDSNVSEEVKLTPPCSEFKDKKYETTVLKPVFSKPITEEYEIVETYAPTTDNILFTTDYETSTDITSTETSTDGAGDSEANKLTNKGKEEGNNKAVIIALASIASVASVAVISYFGAQMIKTMLQSGSFRFPDPTSAEC